MRRHLPRWIATATLAATLPLTACASGGTDAIDPGDIDGPHVVVEDNRFTPDELEVDAGETVTWVWDGRAPHDVVGDGFDSGVQNDGTFEHRFANPGPYSYECTVHPGMTGQITVVEG